MHRTTAVASIAFLLLHITTKIALDHTQFDRRGHPVLARRHRDRPGLIGLGSLAGLLMIFVGITGALRSRFASPAPVAARWRAMHMLAYPAWCAALIHGLYAGRAAKPIFIILYSLCLLGVMARPRAALVTAPLQAQGRRPHRRDPAAPTSRPAATRWTRAGPGMSESQSLPGYESRARPGSRPARRSRDGGRRPAPASPLFGTPRRPSPTDGFAAAYRAVSTPPRADQSPSRPTRPRAWTCRWTCRPPRPIPRMDSGGSTSGSWPIPSPPPVGEAPPSVYDPLQDTGFNIPVYGNIRAPAAYGASDVYDTGETNAPYGTYNPNDTYNSGPATETLPGASFDAAGLGRTLEHAFRRL